MWALCMWWAKLEGRDMLFLFSDSSGPTTEYKHCREQDAILNLYPCLPIQFLAVLPKKRFTSGDYHFHFHFVCPGGF